MRKRNCWRTNQMRFTKFQNDKIANPHQFGNETYTEIQLESTLPIEIWRQSETKENFISIQYFLFFNIRPLTSRRQRKNFYSLSIFIFSTCAIWRQVGGKERFFNFQFLFFSSTCALWRFQLVFSVFYSLLLVSPLITSSFFPLFPQQWMYALYYYLVAMLERKGNNMIKCHCPRSFWEEWKGRMHITWSQRGK